MLSKFARTGAAGAVVLAGLSAPVQATTYEYRMIVNTITVTVSCFRGPFTEVIWDRPNPVFIDSLVNAGYSYPEAHAIGERVCRDPSTVDRPDAAVQVMYRIIAENPPGR
ncbi:helix-turn-helix domain-containing protein [Hasllibacter sp. MH4015]|uniref:helix-turn-helix domain-containing protein n=1 Tax=Hasllibacter sp. MH4015 TaxID=2854029 RepID=UPI001CD20078|nr:helix-turn-helix domain-containing protein [Hasllibacter sp. MH4015]